MPAAIRVDVELTHVRSSYGETKGPDENVKWLSEKLSEVTRKAVEEFVALIVDKPAPGNSIDCSPFLSVSVHEGLGPARPEPEFDGPEYIGVGLTERATRLLNGEDLHVLRAAEKYHDGAFHIVVKCDLG